MIQLYHGDCMDFIKSLPDKSIDLVVTDPPYDFMSKHYGGEDYTGAGAFGKLGRSYHGELQNSNIIKGIDTEKVLKELCRVMKKINIYLWCNKEQIYKYLDFFKGCNMDLLTWHKTNPVPTCSNKYLSDTEYLLYFREVGVKIYGTYETKKKYYVSQTNKKDKELYKHPTIKPLNIIKNLIVNSSVGGGWILDPFMGSGTTGVAAKELGRNFIGCEISDEYFPICEKRIGEAELLESKDIVTDKKEIKQPEMVVRECIQGELF